MRLKLVVESADKLASAVLDQINPPKFTALFKQT
jgi:hypothetical protein